MIRFLIPILETSVYFQYLKKSPVQEPDLFFQVQYISTYLTHEKNKVSNLQG